MSRRSYICVTSVPVSQSSHRFTLRPPKTKLRHTHFFTLYLSLTQVHSLIMENKIKAPNNTLHKIKAPNNIYTKLKHQTILYTKLKHQTILYTKLKHQTILYTKLKHQTILSLTHSLTHPINQSINKRK